MPLELYIASNYKTAICISPINTEVDKTLDEYISEFGVNDVIVQLGFTNMQLAKEVSPAVIYGE